MEEKAVDIGSQTGTARVKRGMAEMLKGGVIMDVVTPEQARIAEGAGAVQQAVGWHGWLWKLRFKQAQAEIAEYQARGPVPADLEHPLALVRCRALLGLGRWREVADLAERKLEELYAARPDYEFEYDGIEPWAWETEDDWILYAEPLETGYRYYYYEPGEDYPYFVRDPDYGYDYVREVMEQNFDSVDRPSDLAPEDPMTTSTTSSTARSLDRGTVPERFARGWHCLGPVEQFRDGKPHGVSGDLYGVGLSGYQMLDRNFYTRSPWSNQ